MLKVIEGEGPDPFGLNLTDILQASINAPFPSVAISDAFGNQYTFAFMGAPPSSSANFLLAGFCLIDCFDADSAPPNGPGIWLSDSTPGTYVDNGWAFYVGTGISSPHFIRGLSYSSPTLFYGFTSPSSPGDIVYYYVNFIQSITNTLSSPVNVYTIMLVGDVFGSLSESPAYVPITFYVLSPPIVFSPGVTMTVSVTLSFPIGIAIRSLVSPTTTSSPTATIRF